MQLKVTVKDTDNIEGLRKAIAKAYGYDESSYLITWIVNKEVATIYNNTMTVKDIMNRMKGGLTVLYEIPS